MGQTQGSGSNDLGPEEFDALMRSTGLDAGEVQAFYARFKKEFPSGFIDKKGFKSVYTLIFPQGIEADKFADHIFRMYDIDGNGTISFEEFVTALHIGTKGTPDEKLKLSFRLYDIDGNGFITQKELVQIISAYYRSQQVPQSFLKANEDAVGIMHRLDTDMNKKLSEDEFVKGAKTCPTLLKILTGRKQ